MLPLAGVRILAVEQYGAGPFGSMHLADMGAEVIKIENPTDGGDVSRAVGPYFLGEHDSHFFQAFNRNKRSRDTEPARTGGAARAARAGRDGGRGAGQSARRPAPRLGVTYDQLKPPIRGSSARIFPRTVATAPRRLAGLRLPDAGGGRLPLADRRARRAAGAVRTFDRRHDGRRDAATALLGGIVAARASGVGRDVDVSLFDTALSNLNYLAAWFLNGGHAQGREPRGAHPSLTPSQLYRTADGWIFIMCNKQKFWPVLCEKTRSPGVVGRSALRHVQGAAGESRRADAPAGCCIIGARHGRMAAILRWRGASRAGA